MSTKIQKHHSEVKITTKIKIQLTKIFAHFKRTIISVRTIIIILNLIKDKLNMARCHNNRSKKNHFKGTNMKYSTARRYKK